MIYVGRDGEQNKVFKLAEIHVDFFTAWNTPGDQNVLLEAPPGHGKTTCLRYQNTWEVAEAPTLRFLFLYDTEPKGAKEVAQIKTIIRSGRFRALYPNIEIIKGVEGEGGVVRAEDSTERFTVTRPNWGSREPTVEAGAIGSSMQGNRYDRISGDDVCPPEVVDQPTLRMNIIRTWEEVVERRLADPNTSRCKLTYTPWHDDDLPGHIKAQIRKGERTGWAIHSTPIDDDADGNPIALWPKRFSVGHFKELQRTMSPSAYARLYRLRCIAEEDRIVTRLCYYPVDGDMDQNPMGVRESFEKQLARIASGEQCLSVDPSATSGKASTETAITQIAMTADGKPYIVDCWFFPGNPVRIQEFLVACVTKEQPEKYLKEQGQDPFRLPKTKIDVILFEAQGAITGMVVLWEQYIYRRLKETGCTNAVRLERADTRTATYSRQNQSKERRLRNTAAYMENGIVKFPGRVVYDGKVSVVPSRNENIVKLCNQMLNFPVGLADGVDTVTQYVLRNESRMASDAPTPEPGESVELENPFRQGKRAFRDRMKQDSDPESFYLEEMEFLCLN